MQPRGLQVDELHSWFVMHVRFTTLGFRAAIFGSHTVATMVITAVLVVAIAVTAAAATAAADLI